MKTATEQPADGQILEKTTRTRVIPLESSPADRSTPEFWTYLQSLDAKPGEWDRHIVYLYRTEPGDPNGRGTPGGKYIRVLQFPDGTIVPLADQEEVELGMARHWGGRVYRFIVKKQHQRITEGRVYIDAPPKPMIVGADVASGASAAGGATVSPMNGSSDVSQIAGKAIDAVAAQETLGIRVGVEALNAAANLQALAANTIKNFTTNPAPVVAQPSQSDQLMQMMMLKMMEKVIDRMDSPAPTGFPGLNGDMVGRFFSTVIERGLNPPVAPNGSSVSGVAAVASVLPQVLSYGAQIAAEIRMKAEAERDTVIAARSPQPPQVQPPAPRPQVLPPAPPAQPTNSGGENVGAPSIEFVETRILQILQQPTSAEEAADAVLMYLHTTDGPETPKGQGSVEQLVKLGESGLVQLFNFRPKLKPATANMPRLLEFIRAFLKLYAEDQEGEQTSPTPPPLPN